MIREEWVQRLSDLVERRLMLLYHRRLSEETLCELAELLVEEGRLDAHAVEDEIQACCERLLTRFGKSVLGRR
jgi:glycerol-3-phosphate dehydrogenase